MAVYLRRGLGRVVLFLQSQTGGAERYREVILNACLNDERYERQTEDGRAFYLDTVTNATGEPNWYVARVCETLLAYGANSEPATEFQRCELAGIWARKGYSESRRALHAAFERSVLCGEPIGEEAVIRQDGAAGFEKVVAFTRANLLPDEPFIEWWHVDQLVETLGGAKEAQQAIQQLKVNSPELAPFYDHVWQNWEYIIGSGREARLEKVRAETIDDTPKTYDEFQTILDEQEHADKPKTPPYRFSRWGRSVSEELLTRLAGDIKPGLKVKRLHCLLRLFRFRAFPLPPSRLFPLTLDEHPRIYHQAVRALMQTTAPEVRAWGLQMIEMGYTEDGIELLVDNPGDGDAELFIGILQTVLLESPYDDDEFHFCGMNIREYYEANPAPELFPALLLIYENGPCSVCRASVVQLLLDADALPDALRDECRYDADEGTREMVAA